MAPPNGTPKNMSSRLMNMKFMQRAAASGAPSPGTPPEPAAKKQRLSYGSYRSTPASTPRSDSDAVAEPQAADEEKREEDSARQAAAHGDSKWYLSLQAPPQPNVPSPLRVVSAGYAALDSGVPAMDRSSEDDEEDRTQPPMAGRRSFGKFNKVFEKQQPHDELDSDSSSASDSDQDGDESDDDTGVSAMIAAERRQAGDEARAERAAKKAADRAETARMAEGRRKKEVNLNNITSISGFGGGGGTKKPSGVEERTCHKCGGKGHLKYQCPQGEDWKRKRGLS